MILQLDATHRVFGAERAWEIQYLRVGKGRPEWRPVKYFPDLDSALREAAAAEIRTAPCEGVAEALKAVDAVIAKYSKIIDGAADEIVAMVRSAA